MQEQATRRGTAYSPFYFQDLYFLGRVSARGTLFAPVDANWVRTTRPHPESSGGTALKHDTREPPIALVRHVSRQ